MNKLDYIKATQPYQVIGKTFSNYEDLCSLVYDEPYTRQSQIDKHKSELFKRIEWEKQGEQFVVIDFIPEYEFVNGSENILYHHKANTKKNSSGKYTTTTETTIVMTKDVDFRDFINAEFDVNDLF